MAVEKFDELNEDNIKDMSLEEIQKLALSGKDELVGARTLIGTLKKDSKKDDTPPAGDEDKKFSKEDMENFYQEKEKEKELNKFISDNPTFEEKKDDLKDLISKGISLETAKTEILNRDKTFANQNNTNQTGMSGGQGGGQTTFNSNVKRDDYKEMSSEEQAVYKNSCYERGKGGLVFSD